MDELVHDHASEPLFVEHFQQGALQVASGGLWGGKGKSGEGVVHEVVAVPTVLEAGIRRTESLARSKEPYRVHKLKVPEVSGTSDLTSPFARHEDVEVVKQDGRSTVLGIHGVREFDVCL